MRTEPACLRWLSLLAVVAFSFLLAQDYMVSGRVYSQESAETLLEEGVASYNDLYIDEGITKLNRAIQLGLENKDDLIRAYKYLAFAYITIGENDKAGECFGKILKLDPFYELNKELSPKILQVFIQAQAVVCLEPRILVIVPEVHGGREVQDPTAETAIINGLLKAGFPVVGKYELSNVRKGASVKRALKGDRKAALDLALQYGANVVIVGEGASEPAGTISGLHSVRVWLYARAFKTDKDIIVGAHSLQISGLGITENTARREAFSLGGTRMADYLVERLAEFRHPDTIKTIRLVINNLRSKSQFDELRQAITNMLLVIDAKVNLFEQDKAELIIKSLGGAQDLVEDLSNLGFIDLSLAKTHEHEVRATVE